MIGEDPGAYPGSVLWICGCNRAPRRSSRQARCSYSRTCSRPLALTCWLPHLVWMEGFEPPSSGSRSQRSTKLSHTQIIVLTDGPWSYAAGARRAWTAGESNP